MRHLPRHNQTWSRTSQYVLLVLATVLSVCGSAMMQAQNIFNTEQTCHDPHDNVEVAQLLAADQHRRGVAGDTSSDSTRRVRVLSLYQADSLQTAADFANASLILQHGDRPEHFLLAHEFAAVSAIHGCPLGSALADMTMYRFLYSVGLNPDFEELMAQQPGARATRDTSAALVAEPLLTLPLIQQWHAVQERLRIMRTTHPEYAWEKLKLNPNRSPADTVTAFVAQTPLLAALFQGIGLTPVQYARIGSELDDAEYGLTFHNMIPASRTSVMGALGTAAYTSRMQQNVTFVQTHLQALEALGESVPIPLPVMSELSRPSRSQPPRLPRDMSTDHWPDPCPAAPPASTDTVDNTELVQLVQADRHVISATGAGDATHPDAIADSLRFSRVVTLDQTSALRTVRDMARGAMILEHSEQPEHLLLAYEWALGAAFSGCGVPVQQLAATSEDRFLARLGLTQRFGTLPNALVPLDRGPAAVSGRLRTLMGGAALASDETDKH